MKIKDKRHKIKDTRTKKDEREKSNTESGSKGQRC